MTSAPEPSPGTDDKPCTLATRFAPTIAGFLALLVLACLYQLRPGLYAGILRAIGLEPADAPFLDATYVLGAAQCWRAGTDVYQSNPCDPLGRLYDYSPLLIDIMPPGVSVAWAGPVGLVLATFFFMSLMLLPQIRVRWGRMAMVLASLSTMSAYALERGNIDALILVAMIGAASLAAGSRFRRLQAYALILAAGLLKFYPLAGLILAARERCRRGLVVGGAGLAVMLLFVLAYHSVLFRAVGNRPAGFSFTDAFAAANLPLGLAYLLTPLVNDHPALAWLQESLPVIVGLGFALRAALQAWTYAGRLPATHWQKPESSFLALGAVLIVGCFFAGFSIYYRGVDFLLVLPGLIGLAQDDRRFRAPIRAILFLMWSELFRQAIVRGLPQLGFDPVVVNDVHAVFWLIRELVWWRVVGVLLGIVFSLAAASPWGSLLTAWRVSKEPAS